MMKKSMPKATSGKIAAKLSKRRKSTLRANSPAAPSDSDDPIVTIKLASANIGKGVGPDTNVKMTVTGGPKIERISSGKTRFLYQKGGAAGSFSVHIEFTEMDPVYPDTAETDKDLSVNTGAVPSSGTDSVELLVEAVGGDVGKSTKCTFQFSWFVSHSVKAAIAYIQAKMVANINSPAATSMKSIINPFRQMGRDQAMFLFMNAPGDGALLQFYQFVHTGAPWDYKADMNSLYGTWTLDAPEGKQYRFDIWGNIHFGFIGRAIGFSEDLLLDAAGFAQAVFDGKSWQEILNHIYSLRDLDQPGDQVAIRVGIGLFEDFGAGVTPDNILDRIRRNQGKLDTQDAPEGVPPESFLEKMNGK